MTAVGEKDACWIDGVTQLINSLNRCGVGTNPDTDDYDSALKIRSKWGSNSMDVSNVSIAMDAYMYEQGLVNLLRAMLTYGRQVLTSGSMAAGTLLGSRGASVDEIDDLTTMLASGSISANPSNYVAAQKLASIVKSWSDIWPLTLTQPTRDPIENVLPVFKALKDNYNEVAMDLHPERVVNGDGSAAGDVANFTQKDAVIIAAGATDNVSLGGLFFTTDLAPGAITSDNTDEQRIWLRNPASNTMYNMYGLNRYSGGYTIDFKVTQLSGASCYYCYANGVAIVTSAAVGAQPAVTSGLSMRLLWTGQAAGDIQDFGFAVPEIMNWGTAGNNNYRRVYSVSVDIPDNIANRAAPVIAFYNSNGTNANGIWRFDVDKIRATGAGGSSRSIWDMYGNPITNSTRLITIVGTVSGVYRDAVFKSPFTKRYLQMLIWYDNYRSQKNVPTLADSVQAAFGQLQAQNGDTLADPTVLTSERLLNLGFWLQGTNGVTQGTLQALYRYTVAVAMLTFKLLCGDVGFIQYVTNQTIVGNYVY